MTVLHVCDYAANYRGNFIESLESLETYHSNVRNVYLFPARAKNTNARTWIAQMNTTDQVAYIQEESFIKNILLFRNIIKTHKVDRIVRHFSDLHIDIIIKILFNPKKVVRFFHCGYRPVPGSLKARIRRFLWKHNRLVGVSVAMADEVKRALPDFEVIPIVNAIEFDRLDVIEPFEKPDKTTMLIMGWDKERKGVDLAALACERLQSKYDLELMIVGGSKETEVKDYVRKTLGKTVDWVRFLPPTNNIGTYYNATDIFLSPSRQEAFGYAVVEAAYRKCSVVLTKVDGQGQIQLDGAYWFESEDLDGFVEQLEKAILERNTPQRIAQREEVCKQAVERYSLKTWSNKLIEILQ